MSQILIVEDEPRIAAFVAKGLRAAGFTTLVESSGEAAVELALGEQIDLVVLDVGLPGIDGFEVLARLRGQGATMPVIMLTARSSVADRVQGLQSGADDYVPKPFAFEELLARIQLRLRTEGVPDPSLVLSHGDLSLDLRTRRADVAGRSVDLTAREFTLAEMFLRNPGMVLSREQLLSGAWGYDFDPGSNVVDVYVRYLRRKLGAERFETVRGMGYRLVSPS
ncbi:Transcriptional regulatory protein TcrA [Propionicimonas sp. T2.31MG-18]|uniref:response regulator transcription factor n=1 Tax=Propionicimonas sp. T2.31MG-18 TaxID=3157620 RepID=UPI0035F0CE07